MNKCFSFQKKTSPNTWFSSVLPIIIILLCCFAMVGIYHIMQYCTLALNITCHPFCSVCIALRAYKWRQEKDSHSHHKGVQQWKAIAKRCCSIWKYTTGCYAVEISMSENVTTDHFIVKKKRKRIVRTWLILRHTSKSDQINYTVAFFIGSKEHLG